MQADLHSSILIDLMALRANLIYLISGPDLGDARFKNKNQVNQPGNQVDQDREACMVLQEQRFSLS